MESSIKRTILFITEKVVKEYGEQYNIPAEEVLKKFLSSKTFALLNNEKTMIWGQGFVTIYKSFEKEMSR
ncbi:MAG: hypothetical protein IJ222_06265 [Bacteroidales bacterium]|nr:hypothetical protein [Bacteroidales bacterium]